LKPRRQAKILATWASALMPALAALFSFVMFYPSF
jgi:hypothetical protein